MINKFAIYHESNGKWSYQYDKDTLHLVLRVQKDDAKEVVVSGGDVYEAASLWHEYKMNIRYSTSDYDYWFVAIKPKHKRFKYFFKITGTQGDFAAYAEKQNFIGNTKEVWSKINTGDGTFGGQATFVFPFLNQEDQIGAPKWVNETVWYQIFPERFNNGNKANDREGVLPWGKFSGNDIDNSQYYGGDIKGITDKLDYIKNLGFNGLYLTPIFKANSAHKYDTEDYMELDPEFGTINEFKELVAEAHKRKMKIMLDGVFNHSGEMFAPWQDFKKHGAKSKYKDWFWINDMEEAVKEQTWASMIEKYPYDAFAYVPQMPRLKWENPDLRKYLLRVGSYWAEMGIDAWRLDVAYEPSHSFWIDFRKSVRAVNPELYIIGEIWTNSQAWLNGHEFDAVMNYVNQDAIIQYFGHESTDEAEFINRLIEASVLYAEPVSNGMFNLLDTHDTPRLVWLTKGDKVRASFAHALLLMQTGSPCIYYGTEMLMEGGPDPDNRRCMNWNPNAEELQYMDFMRKLINLRHARPEWRQGIIKFTKHGNGWVFGEKRLGDKVTYFAFNKSNEKIKLDGLNTNLRNLMTNEKIESEMWLAPKSMLIIG